jgi:site-specific DNA-methyltransferase (adenine-specific)
MNQLYFGDNLEIMQDLLKKHPDGFIDLVYIDPPFNSKRNYNILFEELDMADTKAQKEAFADTWSNVGYLDTLQEIYDLDLDLYRFLKALDDIRISKSAIAYLTMMAIRIWYIHKLLKATGSFYLHCDPTMSHYLKLVCDLVFGEGNYCNNIIWKRSDSHNDAKKQFPATSDHILFYKKSNEQYFNKQYTPHADKTLKEWYLYLEFPDGTIRKMTAEERETQKIPSNTRRFNTADMASPNPRPNLMYDYKGFPYPSKGWRYSKQKMEELDKENRLLFPAKPGGRIMLKRYLDEQDGTTVGDVWIDISQLRANKAESLGYPTQKPVALLERIISASSNEGDLVADFFCGCGTTIDAAQKLNRRWLGVDISHLAVKLITKRLLDSYGEGIRKDFEIFGFPKDIDSARELAAHTQGGRLKFEEWIVEVMLHGVLNPRRNEAGYDGYLTFDLHGQRQAALIEVKSGAATLQMINHFIITVEAKKAQLGIFVCFQERVSQKMLHTAKSQGSFHPDFQGYDKIQIVTVEDLLEGKGPRIPASTIGTFKSARQKDMLSDQMGVFE